MNTFLLPIRVPGTEQRSQKGYVMTSMGKQCDLHHTMPEYRPNRNIDVHWFTLGPQLLS